jgi:hypothetical protein
MGNSKSVEETHKGSQCLIDNKTKTVYYKRTKNIYFKDDEKVYIPCVSVPCERIYGYSAVHIGDPEPPSFYGDTYTTSVYHKFALIPLGKYTDLASAEKRYKEVYELMEKNYIEQQQRLFRERLQIIGMEYLLDDPNPESLF